MNNQLLLRFVKTILFTFILACTNVFSQGIDYYFVEFKEGNEPQNVQTTVNINQTLTIAMDNVALAAVLNNNPIYNFEKAFPYSNHSILKRVYFAWHISKLSYRVNS